MPTAGNGQTSTVMRPSLTGTPSADEICWLTRPRKSSLPTQLCKASGNAAEHEQRQQDEGQQPFHESVHVAHCRESSRAAAHLQEIPYCR